MKKNYLFLLLISLILLFGCEKNEIVYDVYYLDEAFSIVPIVTIMDTKDVIKSLNIKDDLSNITNELDKKFNVFDENSLISLINQNSGIKETSVDDEFIYVLSQALNMSKTMTIDNVSLYDVTIYSVWKEWKFNENYYQFYNYASPPDPTIIKQKLPLVDYRNVLIDYQEKTVYLKNKDMMIDLGSIVKGYAAEKIYNYLKEKKLNNCLIDVGGNVITMGKNIGTNKKWKAGILMPYSYDTEIGYIETCEEKETLVTSGIYQRYIVSKNIETNTEIIYHHLLNPLTGYPEDNDLLSVTIITNNSLLADAYSTSIFLLGLEKGLSYVNKTNDIEAVFITKNKEIVLSNNLNDRFIINNDIYGYGYQIK